MLSPNLHKKIIRSNSKFHHPVLLLVSVYEGVPDLASCHVHVGAHTVRIARRAGAFPLPSP